MKGSHTYYFGMVATLMSILLPLTCHSAYTIDPGFAETGKSLTDIASYDDRAYSIKVQEDGKIVLAGMSDNGADKDFAILRFTETGELDTSFNTDGKATFQVGNADDQANSIELLKDGSILAAGYSVDQNGFKEMAVLKITSSGFLDQDFGVAGISRLGMDQMDVEATGIVVDESENIFLSGTVTEEENQKGIISRFLPTGSLDRSFGENGYRLLEAEERVAVHAMIRQEGGKIVLAGTTKENGLNKGVFYRLYSSGVIDQKFGEGGQVVLSFSDEESELFGITETGNSLVGVGYTSVDEQKNMLVVKLGQNGEVDAGFGSNGVVIENVESDSIAYSIAVQENGTLLITGEGGDEPNSDIYLLQLDGNGFKLTETVLTADVEEEDLVATQQIRGAVPTDINGENDHARALASVENGKVLIAGYSDNGKDDDIALLAYANDTEIGQSSAIEQSPADIPYNIGTLSITNITRNSAMTGGVISDNPLYNCTTEDCRPDITARGVVYGITPYPSYRESEDSTTTTDTTDNTTEGGSVFPDWVENSANNYEVVRSGQTSDGTGDGTYGSDINEITPDNVYYVRAYAVMEGGTVIYGNQLSFRTDDACFIATAAYGSIVDGHVQILRDFRDKYLKTNKPGRVIVGLYYEYSPHLAEGISLSPVLRGLFRLILLPLIVLSYGALHISIMSAACVIAIMLGLLFFKSPVVIRR